MASMAAASAFAAAHVQASSFGFIVPAEELPHEATIMQWPVSRVVHPDPHFLADLQDTIARIANAIAAFEPVIMLADSQYHSQMRRMLGRNITLWDIATDDLWARDSGPLIAVYENGNREVPQIQFNGWGNKQTHRNDGRVAPACAQTLGFHMFDTGLKGEAGGVEQDGHGLLIAHESSWVNDNRNPGLSRDEVSARLIHAYGADRIIWSSGLAGGDITDYHIDSLARFVAPGRVLINLPETPDIDDPFHQAALETSDVMETAGLDVRVIPEPTRRRVQSIDFVASYANYYVCNGAVIMAEFGDAAADQMARETMGEFFPNREIVTLNVDALGEVGGGIHCATKEIPAG